MSNRESLDQLRGHDFLPSDEVLAHVPRLYSTEETPLREKEVWIHYFVGAADWYVMEYDPLEGRAFGWADLGDPQSAELGYFDLNEMAAMVSQDVKGMVLIIERDLDWMPKRFKDI